MAWQQLVLRLPVEAYASAEALLQLAGAASIAITDDGTSPILEPAPETVPLWPELRVSALFDTQTDLSAIGHLLGPIGIDEFTLEMLDDADLSAGASEPITPLELGSRLTIVPADELIGHDPIALGLHMGLAFGTGRHPTTRLCLEWLEREMRPGVRVLDYGAGSGILALAALKLGAEHATAVDIEPQALAATRRNAELNRLERSIRIGTPEIASTEQYDLIVANILARPLIELAGSFARLQAEGGLLVLSGVLATQLDELESVYRRFYDKTGQRERSDWGLLTGVRHSGYDQ